MPRASVREALSRAVGLAGALHRPMRAAAIRGRRTSQISMVCDWLVRLAGIEDGKVDDQEQANAEEGRIGGHVAGLLSLIHI